MRRPGDLRWRETARWPTVFGLDARVACVLAVPAIAPGYRLEVLAVCGALGGFFAVAGWRGMTPEVTVRSLRRRLAGRRRALLPGRRAVKTAWRGQ